MGLVFIVKPPQRYSNTSQNDGTEHFPRVTIHLAQLGKGIRVREWMNAANENWRLWSKPDFGEMATFHYRIHLIEPQDRISATTLSDPLWAAHRGHHLVLAHSKPQGTNRFIWFYRQSHLLIQPLS